MNCDLAQRAISDRMDGSAIDERIAASVDDHVGGCERCRRFAGGAARVRTAVRVRPAEPVPDLVPTIMRRVELETAGTSRGGGRWRRFLPVAAALVAGALAGSVLVGGPFASTDDPGLSARAVVAGVRGATADVEAFQGSYTVVERGFAPDVPLRTFDLRVAFLAPQRFRLDIVDRTAYPSAAFTPADVVHIEDASSVYHAGPTGCPASLPSCPATRVTVTRTARAMGPAVSALAELVVPASTMRTASGIRVAGPAGTASDDDAPLVRLELTFQRARALFPFLDLGQAWRPFFPGDRVELVLETDAWAPSRVTVFPADSPARRAWELRFGRLREPPTVPILELRSVGSRATAPDRSLFAIPGDRGGVSIEQVAARVGFLPAMPTRLGGLRLVGSDVAPVGDEAAAGAARGSSLLFADGLDVLRVLEVPGELTAARAGRSVRLADGTPALYLPAAPGRSPRLVVPGPERTIVLESTLSLDRLLEVAGSIERPSAEGG